MSIPLKVACCATTATLTLIPGVTEAAYSAPARKTQRAPQHHTIQESAATKRAVNARIAQKIGRKQPGQATERATKRADDLPVEPIRPQREGRSGATFGAQRLASLQQSAQYRRHKMVASWKGRSNRALRFAMSQRGKPYVWGGTGKGGYDCSGLVQRSWRRAGVKIPRVAAAQYRGIRTKVSRRHLRPGDLVFFNGLGHVGMYVGKGRFIHSPRPGRHVTVERMRGYYKERYVGARRPGWRALPKIPTRLP